VNPWAVAAACLLAGLVPAFILILRGSPLDGVVAIELIGSVVVPVLLLLAVADFDTALGDASLVLAFLSLGSGLVYVRFFERWI
jgi:multisubunit Na+/H+ antiporter MnhF subunit